MSADGLRAVFRRLRRLADPGGVGLSDAELVERYARTRDEAAFELLLWRHGPMVLGVCRRLLRRAEDAEDAFQATFLALVRRAGTVRRGAAVGGWLYQVACRAALRARTPAAPPAEAVAEPASPAADDAEWSDLRPVLDEEVRRLPARYRDPVVLCYLEGRTHAEAARELGCPKGTVAIRLLRARKLLRTRLTRRGVTLTAGGILAAAATPAAPAALVARTLRAAAGGAVPAHVTALTEGVLHAMSLTRLKAAAALFALTAGLLAAGTAVVSRAAPPDAAAPPAPQRPALPAPSSDDRAPLLVRVPALRDGLLLGIGTEVAPGEQVPAERRFTANVVYLVVRAGPDDPVKPDQVFRLSDGGTWRRLRENELPEPGRVVLHRVKKEFRHLGVGDEVKAGQTVGLVDPVLALNDQAIKLATLSGAEADRRASEKTREEAERRVKAMEESNRKVPGSVSRDDYQDARLTFARYREEEISKKFAVVKAQQELVQAQTLVGMHEIHAPRAGVIRALDKEGGDVVKTLETVLTLEIPGGKRPTAVGAGREKVRDVRGRRDGELVLLGSEVKDGESVAPEQTVMVGTGGAAKRYRRLREGDPVTAGQLVARLDDRLARTDVAVKEAQLRAGESEHQAARKTREEAERRMLAMEESNRKVPGSVSRDDYQGAALTFHRYREEEIAREAAIAVRQAELEQAKALLTTYEIRSPARGVVRELLKQPGEAVKAGEPVLRLGVPVP